MGVALILGSGLVALFLAGMFSAMLNSAKNGAELRDYLEKEAGVRGSADKSASTPKPTAAKSSAADSVVQFVGFFILSFFLVLALWIWLIIRANS